MFCVMIARMVGDRITHPLYHALLEVRAIPFLDWDTHLPYLDVFCARDICASPVVTLSEREPLSRIVEVLPHTMVCGARIVEVLETTRHNAFPVIEDADKREGQGSGLGPAFPRSLTTECSGIGSPPGGPLSPPSSNLSGLSGIG
eukprot:gene4140-45739_t